MQELAAAARSPGNVYFTGGATALLLGFRDQTIDIDLKLDPERCGVAGSPTKVYKVESVVLSGGDQEMIEPTKTGLGKLIDKLMEDHILG